MDTNSIPAIRGATGEYCKFLLDAFLPAVREAAKFKGYAIAVHGSLRRDIDLVAVAWTDEAVRPEELIATVCGSVAGVLGNCIQINKEITKKPHGRLAVTLVHPGFAGEIDLSIIPPTSKAEE